MELTALTLTEAAGLIDRREVSPLELAQAHLERIELVDPRLNSYLTLMAESALQSAREAEAAQARGERLGPLHGLPVALKDLFDTRGVRTTVGSSFFKDNIPSQDAFVVRRLAQAGAVILGKLNMHEIALGVTNANPHFGACHNPWDLQRIPGGSSGGCGAALAAELCLGALGTDSGGSIRIPSSLCGVVGLKPTYGRVSLKGVIPLSWSVDHAGPMARRVADVALLLQVIAGYDPYDPSSVDLLIEDYQAQLQQGVGGWKLALADDAYFSRVEPDVQSALQEAGKVFAGLGAHVEPVEVPRAREAARTNGLILTSDAAAYHRERMAERPQGFGQDVLQRLRNGASYSSTDYALARRIQAEIRRRFEKLFAHYDLLLTPTTPTPAPPIEGPDAVEQARILTSFTAPFNLSGLPALSLPCGFSQAGLPIGLQIVGPPWAEARLLRAAAAFEAATEWHTRRPAL